MLSLRAFQLAQLAAIKHARRALRDLGLENEAWIDPFAAIERAGALLFFAPLRGLCGAYMPRLPKGDAAGILVSITYPLSVQRFTAAHELGHLWMDHSPSVDKEEDILPRGAIDQTRGLATTEEEVKAEAFAAHFLMPMRRVSERIGSLGLSRADLSAPDTVYELSLWFGVSYAAMAWHLATLKQIDRQAVQRLLETKPKEIKQGALGRDVEIDWHNDVWSLSTKHSGEVVHARVGDALTITLPSHATGGYLWDVRAIDSHSLEVLWMEPVTSVQPRDEALLVGSSRPQRAILRVKALGEHPISLLERRPWEPSNESAEFRLTIVAEAVPERGLSPKQRQALIRA
jgi:predicted secreted protein